MGPGRGGQALCRGVGGSAPTTTTGPLRPACWGLCPLPPPLVPPRAPRSPLLREGPPRGQPGAGLAPPMSLTRPPPTCPTASQRGGWGTPARLRGVRAGGTPEQGAVGDDEDGGCLQGMGGGLRGMRGLQRMQGGLQGMAPHPPRRSWGAPMDPHLPPGSDCPTLPVPAPGASGCPPHVPGWARGCGAARDRRVLLDRRTEGRESGERGDDEVRPPGWGLGRGGRGGVTRVPPSLRGLRFFSLYRLRSLSRNTWGGQVRVRSPGTPGQGEARVGSPHTGNQRSPGW